MNTTARTTAVVVGRWQLPHWPHLHLIQTAFGLADQVVIVIGSSWRSRNPKNPFTFQERKEMLLATLGPQQRERVKFAGVRDVYDDNRWVSMVRNRVEWFCLPDEKVTLVGHSKDESSYYLQRFPGWTYVDVGSPMALNATQLRAILFSGQPKASVLQDLSVYMHDGSLSWLSRWMDTPAFAERVLEHKANEAYKIKWPAEKYYTGDAIIEAADRFMMIERGGDQNNNPHAWPSCDLGRGLLAWAGGHCEGEEDGVNAAIREAFEEATLGEFVSEEYLRSCIAKTRVFDSPGRSPRGRIITTAVHIKLPGYTADTLPKVYGRDDAKKKPVQWLTKGEFAMKMHQMFDDHDVIGEWAMGEMSPIVEMQSA